MILSRYVCGGSTSQQRIPAGSARRRRAPARNGNPSGHSHVWWGTELTELTTHRSGYGSLLPMHKKPAGGGRAELGPGIAGLRGVRFRMSQCADRCGVPGKRKARHGRRGGQLSEEDGTRAKGPSGPYNERGGEGFRSRTTKELSRVAPDQALPISIGGHIWRIRNTHG
jgi:hypothetical protein